MTPLEQQVLGILQALEAAAAAMRDAGPKPDLRALLGRLQQLTQALPAGTHPDLLHYMHRQSYEKARLFLQGRAAENAAGTCRH